MKPPVTIVAAVTEIMEKQILKKDCKMPLMQKILLVVLLNVA